MAIHRTRLFHSTTGADSYHGWLSTWLTNMEPWTDSEVTNQLPTLRQPLDGGEDYYHTELAFEWSEDRAIILDQLDQYAASYCSWHRIGYHECTHDGNGGPCSWDDQRESGTVPTHIIEMSP